MSLRKEVLASHRSYITKQQFYIYKDLDTDMFPFNLSGENKPDEFYPCEKDYLAALHKLQLKYMPCSSLSEKTSEKP